MLMWRVGEGKFQFPQAPSLPSSYANTTHGNCNWSLGQDGQLHKDALLNIIPYANHLLPTASMGWYWLKHVPQRC